MRYGVYEKGKYSTRNGTKTLREYYIWSNMLKRCYDPSTLKKNPSYENCTVSDNFKNFQYFAEWCNNQIGWEFPDWELDKDLLSTGGKLYSEETCVFLPKMLNMFLSKYSNKLEANSSKGVTSVSFVMKGIQYSYFQVRCHNASNRRVSLGYFKTIEESYGVYNEYKQSILLELYYKYYQAIDLRAVNKLRTLLNKQ